MLINKSSYQSFMYGRHLNEGVRVTIGIILPAFILSYFNMLEIGLTLSLGALCANVPDSPGPFAHRRNAMTICAILIFFISLLVGYSSNSEFFLGVVLVLLGFMLSMITIYGARASAIGISGLLVMILSIKTEKTDLEIFHYSLYLFFGAIWMLIYSLSIHKLRPYKIINRVLGDLVIDNALYLKSRSLFYDENPDYDAVYKQLLEQQVKVESEQALLSEILFKTRTVVRESTHESRRLLKIYLDITELYEIIMTTFHDYKSLHETFGNSGILDLFQQHIILLAEELEQLGISIKSESISVAATHNLENIQTVREAFKKLRLETITPANVESFVGLGGILKNLEYLTAQINNLHYYTNPKRIINKNAKLTKLLKDSVASQDIRPDLLWSNLNLKSNIFRHSLRVAIALLVGYYLSLVFHLGHNYWILLTIIVILKPAYSITKKRNKDRLFGTLLGIVIGVLILYVVQVKTALLIIMLLFMALSYIFIRTNYFISVLTMTPYLIIFFNLLYPANINAILFDRLLDTAIGSTIAFGASLFLVPNWEHENIKAFLQKMLTTSKVYFDEIAKGFLGEEEITNQHFKISRKDLLVALANVSDAFNRMLSEPKRYQKGIKAVHRFVVLNNILASHFATLAYYLKLQVATNKNENLQPVIESIQQMLLHSEKILNNESSEKLIDREALNKLNENVQDYLKIRRMEIAKREMETETKDKLIEIKSIADQFNFVFNTCSDIQKSLLDLQLELK